MMNFDMVGVNPQLLVDGSGALSAIAKSVSRDAGARQFGGSDHLPFRSKEVPTLFFFRGKDPNYHSPGDKIVDPRLLRETQEAAAKLISQLLK
jgi:aminopeptidase YwaD